MSISKREYIEDVRDKAYKYLISELAGIGKENYGLSYFESYFDPERTYEFLWKSIQSGRACFATLIEPDDVTGFIKKSKECVEEFGFDPLSIPNGFEVVSNIYVFSPNSFPEKELRDLLSVGNHKGFGQDVNIILVTTDKIIEKFSHILDKKMKKKKK